MKDLLADLNQEQIQAVTHKAGPMLIIAGAGTGKTTVIAHRIAWLIEQGLAQPSEILALTFTDKAANEMDARILELLPYGVLDFTAATFHSFCQDFLKDYGLLGGVQTDFQLLSEAQQVLFIKQHLDEFSLNLYKPISNPDKFLAALVKLFSRTKDENVSVLEYNHLAKKYQKKAKLECNNLELQEEALAINEQVQAYQTYEKLKNQFGYFDFGDLITKTFWLLKNHPYILGQIQKKYKYIFVDEFQDTNYVQAQIAYLLASKFNNLTVVGDDDQSIYKFRGASIANIMDFVRHYPQAKIIALTKNYRSTQAILDASYQLIVHNNPERLEVKEKINKKLFGKAPGKPAIFWHFNRDFEEAEAIIKDIVKEVQKGKKFGDFAILTRANSHAENFIALLKDNNIPYQFIGSRGLYDREEIRELRAWLNILDNPDDNLALFYLAMNDQYKIDKIYLRRLTNLARQKNISLLEIFEKIDDFNPRTSDAKAIKKIIELIKKHLEACKVWPTSKILIDYLYQSGAYQLISNIQDYQTLEKIENIRIFFAKISEFERISLDKSLFSFVEYLQLIIEAGNNPAIYQADKYEDAVNLMTIHAAKGLEFETVYLPYLVDGRFPSRERKETIELPAEFIKETLPTGDVHLQEERRLFYVGMTRAKKRLILSAADNYIDNKKIKKISHFVQEAIKKENFLDFTKTNSLDFLKQPAATSPKKTSAPKQLLVISPSNLETYHECPKRFEYSYVFKLASETTQSISFGNSLHNSLRDCSRLLMAGQKLNQKIIDEIFAKNWQAEGYKSKKSQREAYQKGRKVIYKIVRNNKTIPQLVEKKFVLIVNEFCQLKGRIDRVDKVADGLMIIDYKTGDGRKKTTSQITNNLPLWVYAWKFSQENAKEKITLALYYVLEQKIISAAVTAEKLVKKQQEIKEICQEINNSLATQDFPAKPSEFTCHYCSYKSICPYKAKNA